MPRVALTDEQRAQHEMDALCREVIGLIESTFLIQKRMNKAETAAALSLHPNTWMNWRKNNLESCGFRDVVQALRKAGYQIKVESRGGRT